MEAHTRQAVLSLGTPEREQRAGPVQDFEEGSIPAHPSRRRFVGLGAGLAGSALLGACGGGGDGSSDPVIRVTSPAPEPLHDTLDHFQSLWVPADWSELPGFDDDATHEGWAAMVQSAARPNAVFAPLGDEIQRLAGADDAAQRRWMTARLQPYRVESLAGRSEGQLTSYYEPVYDASRLPTAQFSVPVHATPPTLMPGTPWFTREQIDTLPEAQAALQGRTIAWMADPIDAMMLHVQGSGRLNLTEPDGRRHAVRLAFAATNEQPYRSIFRWLIEQVPSISRWPEDVKAWVAQNPQRVSELLWSNPRYVFFREEALSEFDAALGPLGTQRVPLTAGRSIAVDRDSIPLGTPIWLATPGPSVQLQKLVVAQDTGGAILGAVRADYFAGTGLEAGRLAATVNQPLRLWALWPQ